MPGTPPTTSRLALPRYSNGDGVDFAGQVNGVSDVIDAKALRWAQGTTAARNALTLGAGDAGFVFWTTDDLALGADGTPHYWDGDEWVSFAQWKRITTMGPNNNAEGWQSPGAIEIAGNVEGMGDAYFPGNVSGWSLGIAIQWPTPSASQPPGFWWDSIFNLASMQSLSLNPFGYEVWQTVTTASGYAFNGVLHTRAVVTDQVGFDSTMSITQTLTSVGPLAGSTVAVMVRSGQMVYDGGTDSYPTNYWSAWRTITTT